ncbi:helix-turn-helix domain-containing protein [Tardiphaga sp. vice278]|uniref:helix-turn-helix domain-containing protein n=1 Tax=Tardiphaga sp. vice278 TaxID=2592815 RepID=UPI001AEF071F|nr:helix-turn-helix domain-containing protein [Tardiphaga sp. vice278]
MPNENMKYAHSIAEFAQLSGLGRSFLYEQIKSGKLLVRKAGRRTLILHGEGLEWLGKLPTEGQRRPPSSNQKK